MIKFDGGEKISLTPSQTGLLDDPDFAHNDAKSSTRSIISSITPQLNDLLIEAIYLNEDGYKDYSLQKAISKQIHLIALIGKLRESIETITEERNILPITASNRIVSEALRDEPVAFLYEHIGNRYKHTLIDEFQDTSELQWLNLLPLVDDAIAQGNTALIVGDAKQSIYRWRGGKAEQFIALPQFHESTHAISALTRKRLAEAAEVRDLDTNFRSLKNIVHFNNTLIEYLSNELTAEGTAYRNEYTSASATQKTPPGKAGGYVEVNYLGPKDKEDVAYLQHTLNQIIDSLSAGYQFGEIAILIRSTSKEGSLIAEFLEKEGIPVATNDGYSIDSNPWVMCLLSMMRLMLHPGDTSAQVKIMRALTGLYQVPYEPWKYKTNRDNGKSFIDLQKFYRDINLPSTQFTGPKPSAYITCEMLTLQYMPSKRNDLYVKTLLNTILKRGGTGINIDDFLTWWDSLKIKPGVPTNLESNRVQLMTFHKSKGLQFKVCILPIMSWKKDLGRDTRWINTSERFEKLPFTPLSMNNNLNGMGFESIKVKHDADVNFDSLNLIYVAVTRAEERLYITFDTYNSGYTGAAMARSCMNLAEKLQSSDHFQMNTIVDGKLEKRIPAPQDAFCIEFGTPQQAKHKVISLQEEQVAEPAQLPPNLWFDRFEVSMPDSMRSDSGARRLGNLLHDTLSKAETVQDAGRQIQNYERSGAINTSESGSLQTLLSGVYSDAIFIELHQGAKRYSEREILSDGILLRPDLVLVKPESIAVVDFKSGTEDPKHVQQVATYMDHLRIIYNKSITGYVLYLNPVKWVKVQPANLPFSQKTLFD
jgi:ATP-dependent exoDNAse (exonuclease V) beta subunit